MKRFIFLLVLASLFSCSDSDDDKPIDNPTPEIQAPNKNIATDLAKRFTDIEIISWKGENGYHVGKLFANQKTKSTAKDTIAAWYLTSGKCELIHIKYEEVPKNILEIAKTSSLYEKGAELIDASFSERPQGKCYKLYFEKSLGKYKDAITIFCSKEKVIAHTILMEVDNDYSPSDENAPHAKLKNYLDAKYPKELRLQAYVDEEDGVHICECLIDDIIVSIQYNEKPERFMEMADLKFSQLPEALRTALLVIDNNLNDENCEAERVFSNNYTKYYIDGSGAVTGTYDENGKKI